MEKYTVVAEQVKKWYGWRDTGRLVYCDTYERAIIGANSFNESCTQFNKKNPIQKFRWIIISIDDVS